MTLELYHHGSSACAAKVRFALAEKGLEWTSRYVDLLKGEQFEPDFLAINPKAVVPVLAHDGNVIRESTVICEYLEEVFPEPALYPSDPLERANVRIWTKAVDEELHPACSAVTYIVSHRLAILRNGAGSFEKFMRRRAGEGMAARERKWRWIQEGLEAPGAADQLRVYEAYLHNMEESLTGSEWLATDRFTIADAALAPYLYRLESLALTALWDGGRLPRVADWYTRVRGRPAFSEAFVEWMPDDLAAEMRANGEREWPRIAAVLGVR